MKKISRETTLKEIFKTPVGHDILAKVLYSVGISSSLIEKTMFGNLKLGSLTKITLGKLNDSFIDELLTLLNSEKDVPTSGGEITRKWWKEAVIYQIYPRSFKDSDGDGIGDINGIIEKLDYLKDLGVDAIWCSPIYDSPNDDNGYDIRDYHKIMREFGSMEDFDRLLDEIHKRGMRLIMDLVFNHTSDEHEWFQDSVNNPNSEYRDYFIWRKGKGEGIPPNNWESIFSGSAWNYYPQRDEWALHLFSKKQMDLNWENLKVRNSLYDITNWWLEKGVDGFRLDVISFISKQDGLPDGHELIGTLMGFKGVEHYFYGPRLHEFLHEFRENSFGKYDAFTVGECQGTGIEMSRLMTEDVRGELDVVFSFDHIVNPGKTPYSDCSFDLRPMAKNLEEWQTQYGNHCWPTLFVENHDVPRMISKVDKTNRYKNEIAKLIATMLLTLKGTPFIYQGQEIGMTNCDFENVSELHDVQSLRFYKKLVKDSTKEDKAFRTVLNGTRDHARTPMQWDSSLNAGFTTGEPWIKVNPNYTSINAQLQETSKTSILNFYRELIKLRKSNPALIYGEFIRAHDSKNSFSYFRKLGDDTLFIEMNLTNRTVTRKSSTDKFKLLSSNYATTLKTKLRPYEANIYRCP